MQTVKLDPRLSSVAALVRQGSRVADIGTDHAYLPVFLLQTGVSPSAVAADLRKMPLENAKKTVETYSLEGKITTVLSDGLDSIDPESCDDIVIAGMGGLLITGLISRTLWLKDSRFRLVLQPMSHAEDLRRFLFENGFEIVEECCSQDGRHSYCAMAAEYKGEAFAFSPALPYIGKLTENRDEITAIYLKKQLLRLEKRCTALKNAAADNSVEVERLSEIIEDFKRLTEEKDDNR